MLFFRFQTAQVLMFALLFSSLGGCSCSPTWNEEMSRYVPVEYPFDESINGISVFQSMCEKNRHTVLRNDAIRENAVKKVDVIIWFFKPDENKPPEKKTVDWFEIWLKDAPDRVLVIVPGSYSADWEYWNEVIPQISDPNDQAAARAELSIAESRRKSLLQTTSQPNDRFEALYDAERSNYDTRWFRIKQLTDPVEANNLDGQTDWYDNIDSSDLKMVLYQGIVPTDKDHEIALSCFDSNGLEETIIAIQPVRESRVIILNDASFLLNHSLINHQKRMLAQRLIDEFGPKRKRILCLKMGSQLEIRGDAGDVETNPLSGVLGLFGHWPIGVVLWHVVFLGIVICFWKWPIFGRAKNIPEISKAEFGTHIDAYAKILEETNDIQYANEQIRKFEFAEK